MSRRRPCGARRPNGAAGQQAGRRPDREQALQAMCVADRNTGNRRTPSLRCCQSPAFPSKNPLVITPDQGVSTQTQPPSYS